MSALTPELQAAKAVHTAAARAALGAFLQAGARLCWPRTDGPLVTVVLVLHNRAELTLRCLRALSEPGPGPLEILVVDNASSDETRLLLDRLVGVRIIRNADNRGFLRAVNQAARRARGTHLLLLNNDAELLPGSLAAAVRTLESGRDVGAVGGRLILPDGRLQEAGGIVWADGSCAGYGRGEDPESPEFLFRRDVDFCSGAFLLTPRDLFLEVGGFDEAFAPAYYEEVDYCLRLRGLGRRTVYEPDAAVLHFEFGSETAPEQAIRMQAAHREVLVARHGELLAGQLAPGPAALVRARRRPPSGRRILVLDDRLPADELGSGFPRARQLLRALCGAGHEVVLLPLAEPARLTPPRRRGLPETLEVAADHGTDGLVQHLTARRGYYDLVLVSRPHNMARWREVLLEYPDLARETALVYDAEALFARRETLRRALAGSPLPEADARMLEADEVALARSAHAVLAVSPREAATFDSPSGPPVFVASHAVDVRPTARSFADRRGLLFVGAVHRAQDPNADALECLGREILPRLRAALGSRLPCRAAGLVPAPLTAALRGSGVHLLGAVGDLEPLYDRHRVFLVPTRFAAGIPLKIYEAAARGLPVVATPLMADQLGWRAGRELITGDSPGELAAACVRLHESEGLWTDVRAAALERIAADGSPARFDAAVAEAVQTAFVRARRRRPLREAAR